MSVFTEDQSTTTENQNNQNQVDDNQDYVELVVKEKGEQWKDPAALAKGYYHAQQKIKELEQKANKVDVEDFSKQLLEQLKAQTAPSPAPEPVAKGDSDEGNTTLKPDDIQSLIEERLSERERKAVEDENVRKVQQALTAAFGTEARKTVEAKAQEHGLSMKRMDEIAKESPAAYMALVGGSLPKQTNTLPKSDVSTLPSQSGERNFAYYMKLKKTNPRQFATSAIQNAMLEDRKKLGDGFYN